MNNTRVFVLKSVMLAAAGSCLVACSAIKVSELIPLPTTIPTSNPTPTPTPTAAPFGTLGVATTDYGTGSFDYANATAIQSDGKLVVVGYSDFSGGSRMVVIRYNADGTLDTSFNSTGKAAPTFGGGGQSEGTSLAIQSDGKIVVAGYSDGAGDKDFAVVRFNTDGTLDTTFNTTGIVRTDFGAGSADLANGVAIQGDGKIVVVGYAYGSTSDFGVARYNTNGTLDTTFNTTGKVITDIGASTFDIAYAVKLQADGKIVVAGQTYASDYDFAVVRYNANGTLDTTFNTTGKVITNIGTGEYATAVEIQTDNKIVITGPTYIAGSGEFALIRYNANGSLDTTFNTTGKVTTDIGSTSNDQARDMRVLPDGKILVVGGTNAAGSTDVAVVKYNSNGSLDTSFNSTGKVIVDLNAGSYDKAYGMALASDGSFFIAGETDSSDQVGYGDMLTIRFNADGTH